MTTRTCPQCGGPLRRPGGRSCSQACREQIEQQERTLLLLDLLHLLRFGIRLGEAGRRLGRDAESLDRAVRRAVDRGHQGLSDVDLQALRRLVRADWARSREEADAEMSARARQWRWTS